MIYRLLRKLTYLIDVNNNVRFVQKNQIRYPSAQDRHFKVFTANDSQNDNTSVSPNQSIESPMDISLANETEEIIVISGTSTSSVPSDSSISSYSSPESNYQLSSSNNSSYTSASDTPIVPGQKRRSHRPAYQLRRSHQNRKRVRRFGENIYERPQPF